MSLFESNTGSIFTYFSTTCLVFLIRILDSILPLQRVTKTKTRSGDLKRTNRTVTARSTLDLQPFFARQIKLPKASSSLAMMALRGSENRSDAHMPSAALIRSRQAAKVPPQARSAMRRAHLQLNFPPSSVRSGRQPRRPHRACA
jgi:hypothetical protein